MKFLNIMTMLGVMFLFALSIQAQEVSSSEDTDTVLEQTMLSNPLYQVSEEIREEEVNYRRFQITLIADEIKKAIDTRDIERLRARFNEMEKQHRAVEMEVNTKVAVEFVVLRYVDSSLGIALHYLLKQYDFFRQNQDLYMEFLETFLSNEIVDLNFLELMSVLNKDFNPRYGLTPLARVANYWGHIEGGEIVVRRFLSEPRVKANLQVVFYNERNYSGIRRQLRSGSPLNLAVSRATHLDFVDEFLKSERVYKDARTISQALLYSSQPEIIHRVITHLQGDIGLLARGARALETTLSSPYLTRKLIDGASEEVIELANRSNTSFAVRDLLRNSHLSDADKMELLWEISVQAQAFLKNLLEEKGTSLDYQWQVESVQIVRNHALRAITELERSEPEQQQTQQRKGGVLQRFVGCFSGQ